MATRGLHDAALATRISFSRGFETWLRVHQLSLAFTSYRTGTLFLVGAHPEGSIWVDRQAFDQAMGLCWRTGRLYLGTRHQLWRLDNRLRPGELGDRLFDQVLVARNAQTIGDVGIRELGVDAHGRVVFVSSRYSCLCRHHPTHSFEPLWKPGFISGIAAEDRCRLNGLATLDGSPRYATALGASDRGWRDLPQPSGILVDVTSDAVIADGLALPHSPRLSGGCLYLLESGRGRILRIDPANGERHFVAACPGFLRGLAIHAGYAVVTISRPRLDDPRGAEIAEALRMRGEEPWCGVLIVNLATGETVEWIALDGAITELFDVAVLPGVRCPMAIGPESARIHDTISFEPIPRQAVGAGV
ncbi:TIGR03032 family protein [Sphingomonas sp.]|uniref:TIGR03032 family protein n=1 Tax=Sphingomonas sp. TaxID=28214 RepID=UPI001B0E4430|nr:TIGR03032 family protein [Sphingomonas sp.]MBO9714774.1 TIGR03032 family protein [Sphingomonas sp.]